MHEAWESMSEWTLVVADEAADEKARQFFLKLAESWRQVALSYEKQVCAIHCDRSPNVRFGP
jgi:hypothetical protein